MDKDELQPHHAWNVMQVEKRHTQGPRPQYHDPKLYHPSNHEDGSCIDI